MADVNMLTQLYDDFIVIIKDSIIKYKAKADSLDTLEMAKAADNYVRAAQRKDTFGNYYYTEDEIKDAFKKGNHEVGDDDYMVPEEEIRMMAQSRFSIPPLYERKRTMVKPDDTTYEEVLWTYDLRGVLLETKRNEIIDNYVEKNNYYRMLMGLPDYETPEDEYLYVPVDIADEYSIDNSKPIHELDIGQISILYTIGYVDKLIAKYPEYKYLNYLGSKAVDNVTARSAKAFEMIRVPSVSSSTMWNSFSLIYSQCREYFMSCIYVNEHRTTISYYDNFIAMCIMLMTLLQFIARILKFTIERDFFDEYCVKTLFACYNVPYDSALDNDTKLQIVQNLNLLIRDKGTNKVLVDIASILGFDRIKIYKYCLFKNQIFDEDGLPVVVTKKDEITGEEVPDYEKMYEINFKKIDVNSNDYYHVLQANASNQTYLSVTESDPYWINDETLMKDLYDIEYNYAETKYMGISVSYRMTRLFFDNVYALKMLLDNRFKEYTIFLDLPKILTYQTISLFDAVMLLCALTCKMNHLRGNILSSPSKILHVMGFDFTEGFKTLKKHMTEDKDHPYAKYLDPDLVKYFDRVTDAGPYTAEQLNTLYGDVLSLYDFLLEKMSTAKDIREYRAYRDLYYALYYCQEYQNVFAIGDDKVFTDWDAITANAKEDRGWRLARVDTTKDVEHCLVTDKTRITTCNYISNLIKDASSCTFYPAENSGAAVYEFDFNDEYVMTHGKFVRNEKIDFVPITGHKYYISMVPAYEDGDARATTGDTGTKVIFDDELESMVKGCALKIKSRFAATFMEYLMYRNPSLWSFVESCDINDIPQYSNHIINKILKILPDVQMLGQSLGYSSIMEDILLKFIRFFKSYTTDLLNMEVVYILDMKPESMMRLLDYYEYYTNQWLNEKYYLGYMDMEDHVIRDMISTKFHFYEGVDINAILHLFTGLYWMDEVHYTEVWLQQHSDLKLTDHNRYWLMTNYLWQNSMLRLTDGKRLNNFYWLYDNRILFKADAWVSLVEILMKDFDFGFYDLILGYTKGIDYIDKYKLRDEVKRINYVYHLDDDTFKPKDNLTFGKTEEFVDLVGFILHDAIKSYEKTIMNPKDSKMGTSILFKDSYTTEYRLRLEDFIHFADKILSSVVNFLMKDTSMSLNDKQSITVKIDKLRSAIKFVDKIKHNQAEITIGSDFFMSEDINYMRKVYGKDFLRDLSGYYDVAMSSTGDTISDKDFGLTDKLIYTVVDNPD